MHAGADAGAGEFSPCLVSGAAFEALHQSRNRRRGWIGDVQVHVIGFAVELDSLDASSAHTLRVVCSQKVSMASVNTGPRYVVTKTRCGCSSGPLCRARR